MPWKFRSQYLPRISIKSTKNTSLMFIMLNRSDRKLIEIKGKPNWTTRTQCETRNTYSCVLKETDTVHTNKTINLYLAQMGRSFATINYTQTDLKKINLSRRHDPHTHSCTCLGAKMFLKFKGEPGISVSKRTLVCLCHDEPICLRPHPENHYWVVW